MSPGAIPQRFEASVHALEPDVCIVRMNGELTTPDACRFAVEIAERLDYRRIVFNISGVTYVAPAGRTMLLSLLRRQYSRGRSLVLVGHAGLQIGEPFTICQSEGEGMRVRMRLGPIVRMLRQIRAYEHAALPTRT